jgi:photosystem II stability/assembly factor-like uncharacterized protein
MWVNNNPINGLNDNRPIKTLICTNNDEIIYLNCNLSHQYDNISNKYNFNINYNFQSISKTSDTTFIALTDDGKVAEINKDNTILENSLSDTLLSSVAFYNHLNGITVGANGKILKTTNSGTNWFIKPTAVTDNLRKALYINSNQVVACGNNGTILYSANTGDTWQTVESNTTENLNNIALINGKLFIVGNKGILLSSVDQGNSWQTINTGLSNNLTAAYFTSTDTGFMVGKPGIILKTTNKGINWRVVRKIKDIDFSSIAFYNTKNGYAVGSGNIMYKTTDAGETWQEINVAEEITDIIPTSTGVMAVGKNNFLSSFSEPINASYQWIPSTGLSASNIANPEYTANDTIQYNLNITYNNGCIVKDSITIQPVPYEIFLDSINHIAYNINCGEKVQLLNSDDISNSNIPLVLKEFKYGNQTINDIYMLNPNEGYAVGDSGTIYKTNDAWKVQANS